MDHDERDHDQRSGAGENTTTTEDELETLRQALAERDETLAEQDAAATALLARLREAMLASEPSLDRSMVTGNSLDELEASFAAARETLRLLREAVRREQAAAVPAGGSARAPEQPMTPFDKIRAGLR